MTTIQDGCCKYDRYIQFLCFFGVTFGVTFKLKDNFDGCHLFSITPYASCVDLIALIAKCIK